MTIVFEVVSEDLSPLSPQVQPSIHLFNPMFTKSMSLLWRSSSLRSCSGCWQQGPNQGSKLRSKNLHLFVQHLLAVRLKTMWNTLKKRYNNTTRAANNCRSSDNVQLKSAHVQQNLNFGRTLCPGNSFLTK